MSLNTTRNRDVHWIISLFRKYGLCNMYVHIVTFKRREIAFPFETENMKHNGSVTQVCTLRK